METQESLGRGDKVGAVEKKEASIWEKEISEWRDGNRRRRK